MSNAPERLLRGIVIGRRPAGDGSVRVALYTDGLGLVHALAKSAREERSKLRAHLVEGTKGLFSLVRGASVWRVTGVVGSENVYFALPGRGSAKESAARVIGVVRQFVRGEGSDPYLFSSLWEYLGALPDFSDENIELAECTAVLKILSALGYVRADRGIERFLDAPYGPQAFTAMAPVRARVVAAINEGIAASGL
ncbi:MAG: recombination protein O N-terminal domain-containing protein [Patescibacteria group bacterium]